MRRLLVFLVLLPGCAGEHPSAAHALRLATRTDLQSLDPAIAFDYVTLTLVRLLFQGLVDYGDDVDLVPWLAEEMPTNSADGRVYTFRLKPGATFANGREVEAADFVYSLERILDPRTKSPGLDYYRNIRGATAFQRAREQEMEHGGNQRRIEPTHVSGLRALDRLQLQIELEEPDLAFLNLLAMPFAYVVPREVVEAEGRDFGRRPLGSGPFMLDVWERGTKLRLRRREETPHPQPLSPKGRGESKEPLSPKGRGDRTEPLSPKGRGERIDIVEFLIGADELTQQMMFERGELDLLYTLPTPDFVRITHDPRWQPYLTALPVNETTYLAMNCALAPFTDRRVRQALNYAVDKERLVKLLNHRGIVARGVLPPKMPGFDPHRVGYPHDPAKARQLLAEAGYPDGLRVPLWVTADSDTWIKIAQAVQHDLAAVRVTVEVNPVAYAVFDEATGRRQTVPFSLSSWPQDYPDPGNFLDMLFRGDRLTEEHCKNLAFYTSPALDALLEHAARETDPRRRLRFYQQAEDLVVDDAPWVFLYHPIDHRLRQPWVRGFQMHPIWSVRIDKLWLEKP